MYPAVDGALSTPDDAGAVLGAAATELDPMVSPVAANASAGTAAM
jgi:hypothetical protein